MADQVEDIEIVSSSDSVEQVKEALRADGIEIDDTVAEEEQPPAKTPEKVATKPASESDGEVDEEAAAGEEETPPKEEKPKKPVPAMVPRARLNEEIEKRKAAERRLAAGTPPAKEEEEPEAETPASAPQFFSGKPEPQLDTFTKDVDEFDAKAMAQAVSKYTQAHHGWSREEARAEATYNVKQAEIIRANEAKVAPFREREEATIERRPDYKEIVAASDAFVSAAMRDFMYESEIGPDMSLYFAEHPKEAKRIVALGGKSQPQAMRDLEAKIQSEIETPTEEGAADEGDETPPAKVIPPKKPTAKTESKAPAPASRLKPNSPGPKSMSELAGPPDRVGVDIEFNPEYEKAYKAGRR